MSRRKEKVSSPSGSVVVARWDGGGAVGRVTNFKHIRTEVLAVRRDFDGSITAQDGKPIIGQFWVAEERDIDLTNEVVTVKRMAGCHTKADAEALARQWWKEYQARRPKQVTKKPLPGKTAPGCGAVTATDINETARAQTEVLRRQYPRCFEIFDSLKTGNSNRADVRKRLNRAYLEDIAARTGKIIDESVEADVEHMNALVAATKNFGRRKRNSDLEGAIDYEIAFGWIEKGYCFMGDKQLAVQLNKLFGTGLTAKDVNNRRERHLRLSTKKPPGTSPRPFSNP